MNKILTPPSQKKCIAFYHTVTQVGSMGNAPLAIFREDTTGDDQQSMESCLWFQWRSDTTTFQSCMQK